MELSHHEVFKALRDEFGRFLQIEGECLIGEDKRTARILVEIDMHAGLMDDIELVWRGRTYIDTTI